ncbi:Caudovirales tail fiber assembly protein [compost metagenome]|jgi:hypothetical protein
MLNDNGSWMFDGSIISKVRVEHIAVAENQKKQRLNYAVFIISPLQDAQDLELAKDEETEQLNA